MKTFSYARLLSVAAACGWILSVVSVEAQINIGPLNVGPITFQSQPPATEWATASVSGSGSSALNAPALVTLVQARSAAAISSILPSVSEAVPSSSTIARWSSSIEVVVTRPTGNACTLLLARLRNTTGVAVPQITVAYSFNVLAVASEEIPGHLLFYSFTGAAGTWSNITASLGSGAVRQATLNLGNWPADSMLYLLWADDNSDGSTDAANEIDNFTVSLPLPSFVNELADRLAVEGSDVTFAANATGVGPLTYQWSWNGTVIGDATNATLTLTNVSEVDAGDYAVAVSDPRVMITSRTAKLTIGCFAPAFVQQQTNIFTEFGSPLRIALALTGTPPFQVTWYKDGVALGGLAATQTTYQVEAAAFLESGTYSATVSNCFGGLWSPQIHVVVSCSRPVFSMHPAQQTLFPGSSLTLAASASGTSNILYQWYREGEPIAGATNSTYVRTNVAIVDTGLFHVNASNCGGVTQSSNVFVAVIDPPYSVVGLTNHIWRYDQSGIDRGTAWRQVDYDDSAWPTGRGIFAWENNSTILSLRNTELSLTNTNGQSVITYYFRTTFVLTNEPETISFVTSNVFDDGQVVYLNGREVYRMNMPATPITYNTLAPGTTDEAVFWITNIGSENLVLGTNTLAVEVHQVNVGSSDVVMGLQANVMQLVPTGLTITKQPSDLAVVQGQPIALTVGIKGAGAGFQWYKDGVPISAATQPSLLITNADLGDAGIYAVNVSNVFTRVMSRLAVVNVSADIDPPRLLAVDFVDPTHLLLTFSEYMASESILPQNFKVLLGSEETPISNAILVNRTNVLLTVAVPLLNETYVVAVNGVTDDSVSRLAIASGTRLPVGRRLDVFDASTFWFVYDPYPPIGDLPEAPIGWHSPVFAVPSHWGDAPGGFLVGTFPVLPPIPFSSGLTIGPALTTYFRSEFDLPVSRAGLRLTAEIYYNDGAVVYFNGVEIARLNVPDGSTYDTPAIAAMSGVLSNRIELPGSMLVSGCNVIAVELHQAMAGDLNKAFALTLDARYESALGGQLEILAGPESALGNENVPVTFRISATGAESFQWLLNGADVPGATAPEFTSLPSYAMNGSLISVRVTSGSTSITSSNATLSVRPDTTPPRVVAAYGTNATVTVQFSESVDVATVEDPANYVVRDGLGQVIPVLSATLRNGTNVTLQLASVPFVNSTVAVRNIRDTSVAGNIVTSESLVEIGVFAVLVPMESIWRSADPDVYPGSLWRDLTFDDSGWESGQALFYGRRGTDQALSLPIRTRLNLSNEISEVQYTTYYFRANVTVPYAASARVRARFVADDGVIMYVNGGEFMRVGMPAGPVSPATLANRTVDIPAVETAFISAPVMLLPGTNVIAAEVHQVNVTSADVAFAAELVVVTDTAPVTGSGGNPVTMKRWGGDYALEWEGSKPLQAADEIAGPWRTIGTVAPFFASPTGAMMFYRLGP